MSNNEYCEGARYDAATNLKGLVHTKLQSEWEEAELIGVEGHISE